MPRVTLDKQALFALASDTRVEILRALEPLRRTVTQIAEELSIDKGGVHRHLQKLVDGGLVRREDDHGFVYYGLTWKGRGLLNPEENLKIVIHLSLAGVLLLGAGLVLAVVLAGSQGMTLTGEPATPSGQSLDLLRGSEGTPAVAGVNLFSMILGAGLGAGGVLMLILAWRRMRRPRQDPLPPGDLTASL